MVAGPWLCNIFQSWKRFSQNEIIVYLKENKRGFWCGSIYRSAVFPRAVSLCAPTLQEAKDRIDFLLRKAGYVLTDEE